MHKIKIKFKKTEKEQQILEVDIPDNKIDILDKVFKIISKKPEIKIFEMKNGKEIEIIDLNKFDFKENNEK